MGTVYELDRKRVERVGWASFVAERERPGVSRAVAAYIAAAWALAALGILALYVLVAP